MSAVVSMSRGACGAVLYLGAERSILVWASVLVRPEMSLLFENSTPGATGRGTCIWAVMAVEKVKPTARVINLLIDKQLSLVDICFVILRYYSMVLITMPYGFNDVMVQIGFVCLWLIVETFS